MNPSLFPTPPSSSVRPWRLDTYKGDAVLSPCGTYRYSLRRWWGATLDTFVVIGLNPSTADARDDDPTIRRCVDFASAAGCGGLVMLNAYAFRATDPRDLMLHNYPVGPDNDSFIAATVAHIHVAAVVCAWSDAVPRAREDEVIAILRDFDHVPLVFGLTKGGAPRHPLYLPRSARPRPWAERIPPAL